MNFKHLQKLLKQAFTSSLHYSMATVHKDGTPHVTPIGSFMLVDENNGIYFEKYTVQMPKNFEHSRQVCIMGVNSSRLFWLISLILGRFYDHPAVRIYGLVGEKRKATSEEKKRFEKRVGPVFIFEGARKLWKHMDYVREVKIERVETVKIADMTP